MDDGKDYDVQTKVSFRLDFDGSGEFNMLLLPDIQKQFAQRVTAVYERDDVLGGGYIASDLNFRFDGRMVQLKYTFCCHDENEAEAESFSAFCVRGIRKQLEELGCRVEKIDCKAVEADTLEADMLWLEQLDEVVFVFKSNAQKQHPAGDTPGKKSASQKEHSRQER